VIYLIVKWLTKSGLNNIFAVFGFRVKSMDDPMIYIKKIEFLMNKLNVCIQVFDAKKIADWEHLYFSAYHALYAFKKGYNISKKLNIEILLYAAATRQIKVAISRLGITEKTRNVACVIISSNQPDGLAKTLDAKKEIVSIFNGIEDDRVLALNSEKIMELTSLYQISDQELKLTSKITKDEKSAIKNCIIEKIALLSLEI